MLLKVNSVFIESLDASRVPLKILRFKINNFSNGMRYNEILNILDCQVLISF